ncbi:metallophosphoesterase [Natronomonas sp. EA1]|uniref:metallophosphoesterase n=1 Tax=Natronomonas sp. EA1 TaxID=3421655 RepID=UPI003EBFCB61
MLEPLPDEPAAVATLGRERALVVADYHAGLEDALRRDGVEIRTQSGERREHVCSLLDETDADRLVVLGDLANAIGRPGERERRELDELFAAVTERVPMTVVKGNHDGDIEDVVAELGYEARVEVTPGTGVRLGEVGFAHGHTWPAQEVLAAPTFCMAHEHPVVRLEDSVGGSRQERVWLRGRVNPETFADRYEVPPSGFVVFPAFNDLLGGTWVNQGQDFLAPFLPDGLADGEAYLLDGTRLGDYRRV